MENTNDFCEIAYRGFLVSLPSLLDEAPPLYPYDTLASERANDSVLEDSPGDGDYKVSPARRVSPPYNNGSSEKPKSEYLSVSATAKLLGVSRPTIYSMIARGELSFIRPGPRSTRILRSSIVDARNTFSQLDYFASWIQKKKKSFICLRDAAKLYKKNAGTIRSKAVASGIESALFDGVLHFNKEQLNNLFVRKTVGGQPKTLTVSQIVKMTGLSRQYVYDYIHDHNIPRKRVGKSILIQERDWKALRNPDGSVRKKKKKKVDPRAVKLEHLRKAGAKGWITEANAAAAFGLHQYDVKYRAKKHNLPFRKIGSTTIYPKDKLFKILEQSYGSNKSNS